MKQQKKHLKLESLKVKSFLTVFTKQEQGKIVGGGGMGTNRPTHK